jgi:hypothetical protein
MPLIVACAVLTAACRFRDIAPADEFPDFVVTNKCGSTVRVQLTYPDGAAGMALELAPGDVASTFAVIAVPTRKVEVAGRCPSG